MKTKEQLLSMLYAELKEAQSYDNKGDDIPPYLVIRITVRNIGGRCAVGILGAN